MPGFCLLGFFFFFFKGKQKVTVVGLGNICYLGRVSLTLASFESWYASQLASQVVLVIKNPPANAGIIRDVGLIPGLGRSPGGGHGNPLQDYLEKRMDRGAWQAMVHRVAKSRIQLKWFSMHTCTSPNTYWVICQIWNFFTIQLYVLWCTVCLLHHWILPFFMELWEDLYFLPEM